VTDAEWGALLTSLKVATIATVVFLPFGIGAGWLLARNQTKWGAFFEALVMLPLVLPPVVTGYLLLAVFGRGGPIGRFFIEFAGVEFAFNWKGASLAAGIVAFPLMARSMKAAFEGVPKRLEDAAKTLGATRWQVFWKVSLPLTRSGVGAGVLLGFGRALGEFGATITFAGNIPGETRTLPLAIYNATHQVGGESQALRLVLVSVLLAIGTVFLSEWLLRSGWYERRIRQ
tara:strand:+ start:921 stop:1610 length:690 start_codon:yes stop_codon:yes gene_type:complete